MNRTAKSTLLLAAVVAAVLAAALAGSEQPGENKTPALVLTGLDPVHLAEGREVAGSEQWTADHGPFRYRFAAAATRDRFLADPGRYAVQNDGRCGAMQDADGSPGLFAVHDGRIYLFGSLGCRAAFVANPDAFTGEVAKRKVAILLFDGVELLDFAGPGEVFAAAAHRGAFDVFTVAETAASILSQGFVRVTPEYGIADSPRPDLLVVPGGGVGRVLDSPALMDWIRKTAAEAEVAMSVCNGALVLAEAGLLEGLEATTHHGSLAALRRRAPQTRVREDLRFVDNGRVVTSAGVSAGIDAALHVVARLLGEEQAEATARYMEYRWDPAARAGVMAARSETAE